MRLPMQVLDTFLSTAFLPHRNTSQCFGYTDSYPHIFSCASEAFWFMLCDEGSLVSFCSLFPFEWSWRGTTIKAACLGSVATHKNFRKKGLATQLLSRAEDKARELGFDYTFVFADGGSLYQNLGYTPAGREPLFQMNGLVQKEQSPPLKLQWMPLKDFDATTLMDFYNTYKHPSECVIPPTVWAFLMTMPNCTLVTAWSMDELMGYALFEKGIDYPNVFHGFVTKDVKTLELLLSCLPVGSFASLGPWAPLATTSPTITTPLYLYKIINNRKDLEEFIVNGHFYPYSLISS